MNDWDVSPLLHLTMLAAGLLLLVLSWLLARLSVDGMRLVGRSLVASGLVLLSVLACRESRFFVLALPPIAVGLPLLPRSPAWQASWTAVLKVLGIALVVGALWAHAVWRVHDQERLERILTG